MAEKLLTDQVPQANRLERVLERVQAGRETGHARDAHYYAQAATILGLLDEDLGLTPRGIAVARASEEELPSLLAEAFSTSAVGASWVAFEKSDSLAAVSPDSAEAFLLARSELSEATARRRASTLRYWWHALFLPPRDASVPAAAELAGLPAGAQALFEQLLRAPVGAPDTLLMEVDRRVAAFRVRARTNEFIDWQEAQRIGSALRALHERISLDDTVARMLWQATARYFLVVEDADADFDIGGLDDDFAVFNAVVRHLGHANLVLQVP